MEGNYKVAIFSKSKSVLNTLENVKLETVTVQDIKIVEPTHVKVGPEVLVEYMIDNPCRRIFSIRLYQCKSFCGFNIPFTKTKVFEWEVETPYPAGSTLRKEIKDMTAEEFEKVAQEVVDRYGRSAAEKELANKIALDNQQIVKKLERKVWQAKKPV